jgi:hypothetical protein
MSEVLSCPSLKVEDEDRLYDYIVGRMSSDRNFFCLLEFVRFDYLSDSKIYEFFDLISYSPSDLNLSFFRQLRSRLIRAGKTKKTFVPSSPLHGIIAHLTESCGGNVHDHNIVTVTCSRRDKGDEDGIAGQDKVIRSPYGHYLSAQPNGGLEWNRPWGQLWERFDIISVGGGKYKIKTIFDRYIYVEHSHRVVTTGDITSGSVFEIKKDGEDEFTIKLVNGRCLRSLPNWSVACNGEREKVAIEDHSCKCRNAVDLDEDSSFCSNGEGGDIGHSPNNWICYDFRDRRIAPTHYTIRSEYDDRSNSINLRSWAVEVSNDGRNWQQIDRRENNRDLNGYNLTKTFAVQKEEMGRYVRLVNIGRNHHGTNALCLTAWELFGTLVE